MDDLPDLPALLPSVTPLREAAIEAQELYSELRYSGFSDKQATAIVAQYVIDAVNSRDEEYISVIYEYSDDDDDDDDEFEDDDDDRDSGI